MTSVEEALALIDLNVKTVGVETCDVRDLAGRTLAQDVFTPIDLPRFDNAAVDGYALTARDLNKVGVPLTVAGTVAAGGSNVALAESCAVKVMTGARVPEITAAVAMREDVVELGDSVTLQKPVEEGFGVRRRGEEVAAGNQIASRGDYVSPPVAGLLASVGVSQAEVFTRPTVSVIVTGNELAKPGDTLGQSEIYESNGTTLSAALKSMGLETQVFKAGDILDQTVKSISNVRTDVVISTGGVSVGDCDFVRRATAELGYQEVFWRVAMKPGKPLLFAVRPDGGLFFGLPGNPVSALVTFVVFVLPALRKLEGGAFNSIQESATLTTEVSHATGRTEFVRARLDDKGRVVVLDRQGSHMMTGFGRAQILAVLPAHEPRLQKGARVGIIRLPWRID